MSSKKVLILYYSGSGNTKKMAKAIGEAMKSSAMSVTVEDVGKVDISLLPELRQHRSWLTHLFFKRGMAGKESD